MVRKTNVGVYVVVEHTSQQHYQKWSRMLYSLCFASAAGATSLKDEFNWWHVMGRATARWATFRKCKSRYNISLHSRVNRFPSLPGRKTTKKVHMHSWYVEGGKIMIINQANDIECNIPFWHLCILFYSWHVGMSWIKLMSILWKLLATHLMIRR